MGYVEASYQVEKVGEYWDDGAEEVEVGVSQVRRQSVDLVRQECVDLIFVRTRFTFKGKKSVRKCQVVISPNILAVKTDRLWETSLARFLILLINNNSAKCWPSCLSTMCIS